MKISYSTINFRQFELERILGEMREVGFEYFETQSTTPWCTHVDVFQDDPETLVRLQKKYGYKGITSLWAKDGGLVSDENFLESIGRVVEFAKAADIPVVTITDGKIPKKRRPDMTVEDAKRQVEERFGPALEAAKKHGVKLSLENHGLFSLNSGDLMALINRGTPDLLGVTFDTANVHHGGQQDEVEMLRAIKDRVFHVHAKDKNDEMKCVALGEGPVKLKECLKMLKENGYEGAFSWETEGTDDFESEILVAKKSFAFLNQFVK